MNIEEKKLQSLKQKVKKGATNRKEAALFLEVFNMRSETLMYVQRILENLKIHTELLLEKEEIK